jgi:membrane protein
MQRPLTIGARVLALWRKEIWQPVYLTDRSWRGRFYAVLRIISITVTGLAETRATSRAAALSFSTLLSLGPLVAIAVLIAGFALNKNDPDLAANALNQIIKYVAPQIKQYEDLEHQDKSLNPALLDVINNFISGARSSTAGAVSALSLIVIVLLLFTSVENTFNDVWGVRRGRSWLMRVVFYWTILSLGAVFFFAVVGSFSATLLSAFTEKLPFGGELLGAVRHALPVMSVGLIVILLTFFYRFIPNTHVFWRAALIGALMVGALLVLNNLLAFYYFRRVALTKNLYGSLGILPILMLGLYIFWLFVLVGGQISYAVQNVHFRNSQAAWSNLTEATRERLILVVLLTICRRFQACLPPCTASELGSTIKAPTQILNECLNRLVELQLISPIPPDPSSSSADYFYQPARPLNRLTLSHFKQSFENYGEDPAGDTLGRLDPIVGQYRQVLDNAAREEFFTKTFDQLFAEHPFDHARTTALSTQQKPA